MGLTLLATVAMAAVAVSPAAGGPLAAKPPATSTAKTTKATTTIKTTTTKTAIASASASASVTASATMSSVSPTVSPTPTPSGTPTAPATPTGSLRPGQTTYPVPAGALHVAVTGDDGNPGSAAAPLRSIGRAVSRAIAGQTVVVHAGVYREAVESYQPVILQAAPGEEVWFDSTVPLEGWVSDGSVWRLDGWTVRFDASPTYTQGAPDNTEPGWQFVNPAHPMASHPDLVLLDGIQLNQVASRAQVTAGTFHLDEATSTLYLGSDPTGHEVRAATLQRALQMQGAGSVVRGIGIRRYAPSVWQMGTVTVEAPGITLENVWIEDIATQGVAVIAADATLRGVTITRTGLLGLLGDYADRLTLSNVVATGNNREQFNIAPASGGAKLCHLNGLRVTGSSFSGNLGHGLWTDCSVYDITLANSVFTDNVGVGIFLELSAKAVVAGNLIARNREAGVRVNNTSDVRLWNNTIVGDGRPLDLVQDARRNTDPTDQAVDPRRPRPDAAMPWTLGPVHLRNNVVSQATAAANCVLCVEDHSGQNTAEQMGIDPDHAIYHRPDAATPVWLVVWSKGAGDPWVFTTLAAAQAFTGRDLTSRELRSGAPVAASGALSAAVTDLAPTVAEPLPAEIAAVVGQPVGTRWLGAW